MRTDFKLSHVCLFVFTLLYPAMASYKSTFIKPETAKIIKDDTPSYVDLTVYIPVLTRVVDYCEKNKKMFSLNLIHGLFLLNVNLETYVNDDEIPEAVREDLKHLLKRSEKLQNEYNNNSKGGKMKKLLAALTSNATSWAKRVPKLSFDSLLHTHAYSEFPQWETYFSTVEAIDRGTPSPTQSDKCVGSLLNSEENLSNDMHVRCKLPDECYSTLTDGTDFGYWLTHRIIILLHARLSRNCAIFSVVEDNFYKTQFCEMAYREAEYIVANSIPLIDLFLEQIAICALAGNAQFLRRSWLVSALEFQQSSGCFQLYRSTAAFKASKQFKCDDHAMAVAVATYAAAVRLILENLKLALNERAMIV